MDSKQHLSISTTASSKSCLDPEFLKAIPIMKTRSGMQVCVYAEVMWVHVFKASMSSYVSVLRTVFRTCVKYCNYSLCL